MTITKEQRQYIREIAGQCCEYCRVIEDEHAAKFQIDHIIPKKHSGTDETDNLCLACYKCNGYKGPNVAALDPLTGDATKLFDPRKQVWNEHFELNDDATISGISPEGRTTIDVLRINDSERVFYRKISMLAGDYPCQQP